MGEGRDSHVFTHFPLTQDIPTGQQVSLHTSCPAAAHRENLSPRRRCGLSSSLTIFRLSLRCTELQAGHH